VVIRPVGEKAVPVEGGKHLIVRAATQTSQENCREEEFFDHHGDNRLQGEKGQ
jgi:hypothetical protein